MPNVILNPVASRDKIISSSSCQARLDEAVIGALLLDGECFQHLLCTFPNLSYEKIKAGVFDGAQIRTLVRDQAFIRRMNVRRRQRGCLSFVDVIKNFLRKGKAQNCGFSGQHALSIPWLRV